MSGSRKEFTVSENRDDLVNNKDQTSFVDLPKDMVRLVGCFIPADTDKDKYARLCKQANNFFQSDLDKRAVEKLLHHVAYGEKDQAEKMLKSNPKLLLGISTITDEAGRTIYGTAYQIALGAKDVSPFPGKVEEMAEMLERYLLQLPNGEKEREKQYNEQFPEGFEKQEEARRMSDSLALNKVFAAIKNAKTIEAAEEAVKEFQLYLTNQTKGVITTGYHFNEALFEEALTLYERHHDAFGGFNSPKNRLAALKLIGFIESLFPASLAQAACDGFGKVVDEKKALSRSKLLDDKKTPFFDVNLGVTHFVYSFSSCATGRECGRTWKAHCFKTYVEKKQQAYQVAKYRY